jgi:hypothetical protein
MSLLRFGVVCAGAQAITAGERLAIRKLLEIRETEFALFATLQEPEGLSGQASDAPAEFGPVPQAIWKTKPDSGGYRELGAADIQSIRASRLDVLLDFSDLALAGEILDVPAHGVWKFSHELDLRGSLFTITLHRLRNPPGSAIPLKVCAVRAKPTSPQTQLDSGMVTAADLPASVCKCLLRGQADCFSAESKPNVFPPRRDSWWRRTRTALARRGNWIASQIEAVLFVETWNVGILNAPIHRFLEPGFRPDITWVSPVGRYKFIADPFAIATGDGIELIVEEFDLDRYQGYIRSAKWIAGCEPTWELRIDENVHMSYPFPIQHGGKLYVMPESSLSREVALYEFESTPGRWRKTAVLIENFAAIDSTLIQHDGQWWLFCACREDCPDTKLYLWYARDLFGPWQPHRMNPVKSDVRSSRPGGTPFWHQGSLYRPAQDSSHSYGGALTINRVTRLASEEFREEPVVHLEPFRDSPYPDGVHTLSAVGSLTVLDGKRMAFLPRMSARRLRHKFRRIGEKLFPAGAIS